jgi:hypothetical protein
MHPSNTHLIRSAAYLCGYGCLTPFLSGACPVSMATEKRFASPSRNPEPDGSLCWEMTWLPLRHAWRTVWSQMVQAQCGFLAEDTEKVGLPRRISTGWILRGEKVSLANGMNISQNIATHIFCVYTCIHVRTFAFTLHKIGTWHSYIITNTYVHKCVCRNACTQTHTYAYESDDAVAGTRGGATRMCRQQGGRLPGRTTPWHICQMAKFCFMVEQVSLTANCFGTNVPCHIFSLWSAANVCFGFHLLCHHDT